MELKITDAERSDAAMQLNDGVKESPRTVSFLMIGQSNMAGRGDFEGVEPIRNEMCYMLRMGRWQEMREPVNTDRNIFADCEDIYGNSYHSGIGLAPKFADLYAKTFGRSVGLIPCADGGTQISQWQPGELLYDHAVMQTKLALRTSDLGGILWHQGESDCHEFAPVSYRKMLLHFFENLRRDIGAEDLPVVIGEIPYHISPVWRVGDAPEKMNALLRELAGEIPNCAIASADGLSMKPDGIHFDSRSYRVLGQRYFDAYRSLL